MHSGKLSPFLKIMLFLGLAFLYIPLVMLIIYSFNESKLVTVWGGFSTKWYGKLLDNRQILNAAWLSLKIAVVSSLAAVALGTMAGYALARIKRFRGSTLFAGMVSAPMVMPDVITGLSMLLLIIQVQGLLQGALGNDVAWLDRGFFTIFLGHTTLCMAYITVVIRSRLVELDQSLEEAAMDLGARLFCDYVAADYARHCVRLFARHYPVAGRFGDYVILIGAWFINLATSDFLQNPLGARPTNERVGNHYDCCRWHIGFGDELCCNASNHQTRARNAGCL